MTKADDAAGVRRHRTPRQRAAIGAAHGWVCVLCPEKIDRAHDTWVLEHVIALAAGGTDTDDNIGPAHTSCAVEKTKRDARIIAKIRRVRARHLGTRKPPRRPIPGSRCTPWKKHLDGTVCRRPLDAERHRPFVPPAATMLLP